MKVAFDRARTYGTGREKRRSPPRPAGALALAVMALALLGAASATSVAHAQQETMPDWEPTGLSAPALQLYTPASGAFFARGGDGLWRSDDAGATWRSVALPPGGGEIIAVDPAIHMVIYAAGQGGLYKTGDDAASWSLVLPTTEPIQRVVVSPADNRVVYALVGYGPYAFYRSPDGGATWERKEPGAFLGGPCNWEVWLVHAHPTDPLRLFATSGCFAGRNRNASLSQSLDQGNTWSSLFLPDVSFPNRLVGGQGVMPGRLYLTTQENRVPGSAWLYRSDDDGASWSVVLVLQGAATWSGDGAAVIDGLAYDPAAPDTVYLGLSRLEQGVRVSRDGGLAWEPLGQQPLGDVHDLVLGVDGLNLYAATDAGVWRLQLAPPPITKTPPAPGEEDVTIE